MPTNYGGPSLTPEEIEPRKAAMTRRAGRKPFESFKLTNNKRDFAVRSGLLQKNALFQPEQLVEVYRSIHETLDSAYSLTDSRRKLLEDAARQIEEGAPDLGERMERSNQEELDLGSTEIHSRDGMQFN